MGLSRDVDWGLLSLAVWPLEGVKVDSFLSHIFANISQTVQVKDVKLFHLYNWVRDNFHFLYIFFIRRTVCPRQFKLFQMGHAVY